MQPLVVANGYDKSYPKQMLPIGKQQRPILEYTVRLLCHHGIKRITFVTRPDDASIRHHFATGKEFGVEADYHEQRNPEQGTAGIVAEVLEETDSARGDALLYYGDILTDMNVRGLLKNHKKKDATVSLAVAAKYSLDAVVPMVGRSGLVSKVLVNPELNEVLPGHHKQHATVGVFALSKNAVGLLLRTDERGQDMMRDFIPRVISTRKKVAAYVHPGFWTDVGTPEKYASLSDDLVEKTFAFLDC